jgi:signal transduction histidine kinase
LINLVANAINYNDKETTEIELKVESVETNYVISLSDNGPGIPKKHHGKIFDLFSTLSNVDRFGRQGTGIGLSTVKKTVEDLGVGGTISVDSKLGRGTTFRFTLKNGTGHQHDKPMSVGA